MSIAVRLTIIIGVVLILLGLGFYVSTETTSITPLIPSFLGGLLLACGLVSRTPAATKIAMHFAVLFAVLGAGGSTRVFSKWADLSVAARSAQLITFALCLLLVVVYVRSFIAARKAGANDG